MAITAKFVADFSDFHKGVQEADAKLATLSASAGKAGDSVGKLSTVTAAGVGPANTLRGAFQQFDGVLAGMGVHIGPQIKGLEDIAAASGKTTGQLGKAATAGLAVGVAFAGWQFGRMIAGWFDLDQKIGNATAKLLGWGDVAGQTAGAVQDTINRALKDGAAAGITYAEAIQFNIKHLKEFQEGNKEGWALNAYTGQLEKTATQVDNLSVHQKHLIDRGVALNKSHADIAKGLTLTVDAVDSYVAGLARQEAATKKAAADAKDLAADLVKLAKAEKDLYADMKAFGSKQIQELTAVVQAEMEKQRAAVSAAQMDLLGMMNASAAKKQTAALGGASSLDAQLETLAQTHQANLLRIEQAGLAASSQGGDAWLENSRQLADEANSAFQTSWDGIVQGANAGMGQAGTAVQTIGPIAAATAAGVQQTFSLAFQGVANDAASIGQRIKQLEADADKNFMRGGVAATFGFYQKMRATELRNPGPGYEMPKFDSGGPVTKDGPIYAHAGEFVLPKGAGGGAVIHAPISIVVGAGGNAAQAGREAADALLARLKSAGVRV